MLWIILIVLFVILLIAALSYGAFHIAFHNPLPHKEDIHAIPRGSQYQPLAEKITEMVNTFDSIPYDPVSIKSHDGLTLSARYYNRGGHALDIAFHGYRSTGVRDFCGGAQIALNAGHDLLLVDERSHGKSDGTVITFGIREHLDCMDWILWARDQYSEDFPIYLDGVSMGAATVIMASSLSLPKNIVGIVADCPYSSPIGIIKKVCRDHKIPVAIALPFVHFGARIYGHFNPAELSAVDAVKKAQVPILIIHGRADRFVPYEMGLEIFEACTGDRRMLSVPEAGHALSFLVDPERYQKSVISFYEYTLRLHDSKG